MSVDICGGQTLRQHEYLKVIQQLRDLLGGGIRRLVLGCHPHLGSLLDDLLPDRVYASIELGNSAGPLGAIQGLLLQLRE